MTIKFTVDHDHTYEGDEGEEQLVGWIYFTVTTKPGDFRSGLGGGTPKTIRLPKRSGWLAADGHVYTDAVNGNPLRLVANDPDFNLDHLTYKVDFELTTLLGEPVDVPHTYFPAPSTDVTVYLTKFIKSPGQTVMELSATVYSDNIIDAGAVGLSLIRAQTIADVRTTAPNGPIDLRDWDDIRNGQWTRAMGAWSSGGHTITNNTSGPFTQADVGKLVIDDNTGFGAVRWFTEIVSVNAFGVATVADAFPYTKTNDPFSYGFDITEDLNAALAEIAGSPASGSYPAQILSGSGMTPRECYLPGWYRCSQIVVPLHLTLRGAGWGTYGNLYEAKAGTILQQLPGSECDFLVFSGAYASGGERWIGPVGVTNLMLQGPEWNVAGQARTTGSGFALRDADGNPLIAQDGSEFSWIHSGGFPEDGFDLGAGGVPLTLRSCRAFYNGGYGWNYQASNPSRTQMVYLPSCSGDANVLGGARFKGAGPYGSIAVTAFKSEAVSDATYKAHFNAVGGPESGYDHAQMSALIFEDCDDSPIVVNGVSHIYAGSTHATGPTMLIKSAATKVPRLSFNGIATRLAGTETGDISASVTLRDEVSGIDIPRSVVSGYHSADSTDMGWTGESVSTTKTLGIFTDHTVLIESGGAPTLSSASVRGARCAFINTTDSDATVKFDAGVVALLAADDQVDTSTTLTDSSLVAANWTAHGNAQIDTAQKKYGAGAILFDGTSDYITPSAAANFTFGLGDFTIEMWLRLSSTSGAQYIFDFRPSGTFDGPYPVLNWNGGSSNALRYQTDATVEITGPALSVNTWYHVALSRAAGQTRLFVNGGQVGSTFADTYDYTCPAGGPWFGGNQSNSTGWLTGWIDDLRITKGAARYRSNFTPPTRALTIPTPITLPAGGSCTVESDGTQFLRTDRTTIVGLTGTLAEFNTACSDADFATKATIALTSTATLLSVADREYTYLLGSGAVATIPTAVSNTSVYHLINTHTASLSVATTSSQTVSGASGPLIVLPGESYTLVSDNTNWWIR